MNISTRFILAAFFARASLAFAAPQYSIQGIGGISAYAINDSSTVAGSLDNPIGVSWGHTVFWNNGNITQILPPGFVTNAALQMNNSGEIVGLGETTNNGGLSFEWDPAHGFSSPPVTNGQYGAFAAINNLGQIGGTTPDGIAAVWTSQNNVTLLPALDTGFSEVRALNDVGQAVGTSGSSPVDDWPGDPDAPYGFYHAVLWQNGTVTDLTPTHPFSRAIGINNGGQAIGVYLELAIQGTFVPFVWDALHGEVDLPTLGYGGDVDGINNSGQIVGLVDEADGYGFASIWDDGALYDLNDLVPSNSGWDLQEATAINNLGQIAGFGLYDGQPEGFLLTPTSIPEPAALLLFLPALLLRRRMRGAKAG